MKIALLTFLFSITIVVAEDKKLWSGDSELGYKLTKGNSNDKSLSFRQSLIFDSAPWKNTLKLAIDNTTSNDVRSEEKYYLTEKLDRNLTPNTYAFIRGSYEKDLFSSFDFQSSYVLGLGHKFLNNKTFQFSVDMGVGGIYEKLQSEAQSESGLMYYLADEFIWRFSETAEFGQTANFEFADLNTISRASVYLKTLLVKGISLRLSYSVKHNNQVAEVDGTRKNKTDIESLATIVYAF